MDTEQTPTPEVTPTEEPKEATKGNDEVTKLTELANRLLADNDALTKQLKSANSKAAKAQPPTEETAATSETVALKAKVAELEKASEAQAQALAEERMQYAKEAKLSELLPRISTHRIMRHEILPRIGCEIKDGKPETFVVDDEGNRVVMTWDKLVDEFRGNKEFADFVIQSEATGSKYEPPKTKPENTEKIHKGTRLKRVSDMMSSSDRADYYNKRAAELGVG